MSEGPKAYLERTKVPELVDECIMRLNEARPEDPRAFLGDYLSQGAPAAGSGKLELYLTRVSVNCHGAWLVCRLGDVDFEVKDTDLMKGEHLTPEYLKINANGQVPAMRDADGTCMGQGTAIMRYICQNYAGARKLYPAGKKARALCEEALEWRSASMYQAIADIAYPALGFAGPDEAKAEAARKKLSDEQRGVWKVLTQHFLAGKKFICGDDVSIADLTVFTLLGLLDVVDYELPAEVKAYKERCWAATNYEEVFNGAGGFGIKQYIDMKKGEAK